MDQNKITGQHVEPLDYGNIPGCTYCYPEVALVGLKETQAGGSSEGFVKVIFDAKYGDWLGCYDRRAGVTDMIAEAVLGRKLETTGHEVL